MQVRAEPLVLALGLQTLVCVGRCFPGCAEPLTALGRSCLENQSEERATCWTLVVGEHLVLLQVDAKVLSS